MYTYIFKKKWNACILEKCAASKSNLIADDALFENFSLNFNNSKYNIRVVNEFVYLSSNAVKIDSQLILMSTLLKLFNTK